jgi:hypothetical protein
MARQGQRVRDGDDRQVPGRVVAGLPGAFHSSAAKAAVDAVRTMKPSPAVRMTEKIIGQV